ncbi:hypothetical protein B0H63DRAFT_479661 [Podospora didyma]|uniref:ZW10 C-terminal helical domain-containing protein n=1 Tax=Podospora didyma TaxID=330526 RepID=A0AAE0KKW9_9PEZI|nr:hypothetical protein B0H63DRAFT_479661 [Podospora didyma]
MASAPQDSDSPGAQIAQALVDFSVRGAFPEEHASSLAIDADALPPAIQTLAEAKSKLQAEIHQINEETADDVRSWQTNAQSVQDDIIRSKALANDILKAAEAPVVSGKTIEEAEAKASFLIRELNYNSQVQEALKGIRGVTRTLDQVEQARDERRILDALHLLERSWKELDAIPISQSCRAIKLLNLRAFELKSDVHVVLDHVWSSLIHVDAENHRVSISGDQKDGSMSLSDAVIGLKAYKVVDQRTTQLWREVNKVIFIPRMDIARDTLPGIHIETSTLEVRGSADKTVESLFADLKQVFSYLVERLPPDIVETMSSTLLPEIIHKITRVWLDSIVPSSLQDMERFQDVITAARGFCDSLKSLGFSYLGELQEWTDSAPRVWLSKCREAALDAVRTNLSRGLGASKQVERVEKQMVSRSEGKQLAATHATASDDDHGWGDAWADGEEEETSQETAHNEVKDQLAEGGDDGTDAWGWGVEDTTEEKPEAATEEKPEAATEDKLDDDEDATEAWGWGDEANNDEETDKTAKTALAPPVQGQTRELILKEVYSISSMPEPVLDLIFAIIEDGAALTQESYASTPVAAAASGLFSLPTLALAMFRAVSPYYYAPGDGGNMFLYNDANYLSERLADFAAAWKTRDDISIRAKSMLRLDNDIKSLQNFAARAYSNEMSIQKTILKDMLGGEQNLTQQDETESCVSAAVARVRSMAITWEPILSRSAWQQAAGALADAVATKIIVDVMDLPAIGQDEAYNIANLIATVTGLDDLFLPSRGSTNISSKRKALPTAEGSEMDDEVPTTAQHAPNWLRLKYLSEVLQSNLKDVRYLWVESELSLYFSVDEVIYLINLSFEDNPRTREVVKEITQNPHPTAARG